MKVTTNAAGNIVITTDFFGETSILIDSLKVYAENYYNRHHTPLSEGFNALPSFNEKHYDCAYAMYEQVLTEYIKDVPEISE